MIQDAVVFVIVAMAAAWPLRAWLAPSLRRAMTARRAEADPGKGECADCGCGR